MIADYRDALVSSEELEVALGAPSGTIERSQCMCLSGARAFLIAPREHVRAVGPPVPQLLAVQEAAPSTALERLFARSSRSR